MKKRSYLPLVFLLTLVAACAPKTAVPQPLTVMTHDSFAVSESLVRKFEQANDARVSFIKGGDAGSALNKVILSRGAPLADVFYGVDNTFLSRALEAGIYEAYAPAVLQDVPAEFQLDPLRRALPIDFGDVCINYDKAYFAAHNLAIPQSLEQLTGPEYKGLLVVENPATSSPGLAFLMATVKHFGGGYLDYWNSLEANGLVVVDGWETAYYTNFSGSSGKGPQPMVVSYATSPAAEVMFSQSPLSDAPTASILGPDTCFRQIEFAGILKGTSHRSLAEKFIDFLLTREFQADMPAQMFVYPVLPGVTLPSEFVKYARKAAQPARLAPDLIASGREAWIEAWTETVLR